MMTDESRGRTMIGLDNNRVFGVWTATTVLLNKDTAINVYCYHIICDDYTYTTYI